MEVKIRTPKITDHLYVMIGTRATRVPLESFTSDQLKLMGQDYINALIKRRGELRDESPTPDGPPEDTSASNK